MIRTVLSRAKSFWEMGYWLHWFIALLSVSVSLFGVYYAVVISGDGADGGRGGAVGTAICFAFLFAGTGLPLRVIDRKRLMKEAESTLDLTKDIDLRSLATKAALKIHLDWISDQSLPLFVGSFTSTLFWGFGDEWAKAWLYPPACTTLACGLQRISADSINVLLVIAKKI